MEALTLRHIPSPHATGFWFQQFCFKHLLHLHSSTVPRASVLGSWWYDAVPDSVLGA